MEAPPLGCVERSKGASHGNGTQAYARESSRMKVALLGGASSIHTIRWANGLASHGVEVHLISAHPLQHPLHEDVAFYALQYRAPLAYLFAAREVRRLIERIRPDVFNAHYATGYGLLARLTGFGVTLLSVWGSDIYDFPTKSFIHRRLLRGNLKFPAAIASTSKCMALELARTYAHASVFITPFGVDTGMFRPHPPGCKPVDGVVVGTVKSLAGIYGVDILIRAFAHAWQSLGRPSNLYLEISGDGPDREALSALAAELGVGAQLTLHGAVSHDQVPAMIHRLDIFVALSRFESFGVAVLEAAACEVPVVVSDAEGLAEVTRDGVNGFIVPREDVHAAAMAMIRLIEDPGLRKEFGRAGRLHVTAEYSWGRSIDKMMEAYAATIHMSESA